MRLNDDWRRHIGEANCEYRRRLLLESGMGKYFKKQRVPKKLPYKMHRCGDGYKGKVIKVHGIAFCQFCGKELKG